MLDYLIRRLLVMIPTLIAVSVITFVIIQLPPGDYLSTLIAEMESQGENVDVAKIAALREQYGLDRPLWEQYLVWAVGMLRGAERPLMLCGGGVHISRAAEAVTAFAEATNIPVAHTMSGKGSVACTSALSAGLFGRSS